MPISRYPTCPMLEYASMRLMLLWASANQVPHPHVAAARAAMMVLPLVRYGHQAFGEQAEHQRERAAFDPTAM